MGKRLSEKNPFLRDPDKKRRLMLSAIAASQRQEGIEISDARAEEVYRIVFEEPRVAFLRLTQADDAREKLLVKALAGEAQGVRFDISRRDLLAVEGAPLSYWLPAAVLHLFRTAAALQPALADARQGMATANDPRFVRHRWEVLPSTLGRDRKWVPFAKGGAYSPFYSDVFLAVNWEHEGTEIKAWADPLYGNSGWSRIIKSVGWYLRPGLTWPLAAKVFNVRAMPGGCIFGHKGPAIFPKDPADSDYLLGVLNSSIVFYLCKARTSREQMGGRWEVGVIQKLPIPRPGAEPRQHIASLARHIHDAKAAWAGGNETSTRFREPWLAAALRERPERPVAEALDALLAREAAADAEIQAWYAELDGAVFDAYGLSPETREVVVKDLGPRPPEVIWPQMEGKSAEQKRVEHVIRLLSFYVKGTVEGDDDGIVPLVACNNEPPLEDRVLRELAALVSEDRAHILEGELASELRKKVPGYRRVESIGDFLANAYFEHHVRLYKSRPIFWHLASAPEGGGTPAFAVLAHYHRFRKDALRKLRGTHVRSFIERRGRDLALARQANRTDEALEIQRDIEEAQAFDKKLQALEEGRFPIRVPWKKAAEQPKGWDPDIDDGVKVNILPLQTAGLLRIAKVVSTKGIDEE
ncbi:MAG: hypothetical protein HYU42_14410 [Candidatus Rokubacteria bacterium]|nr:hypothetical protein [Candidatus Rokubacteria bacterium]